MFGSHPMFSIRIKQEGLAALKAIISETARYTHLLSNCAMSVLVLSKFCHIFVDDLLLACTNNANEKLLTTQITEKALFIMR